MSNKHQNDSLGNRMKAYEVTSQQTLIRRMPVIIRLDGKAFHTWTKRLKHIDPELTAEGTKVPFSNMMNKAMSFTTEALFSDIQNCAFAYTQSDEISLFIRDWDTLETEAWFGNNVQKMVSVGAATATAAFNFFFKDHIEKLSDCAKFDARVFNLPREEVVNYFIWRQNDATRNSVQMLGHLHFSQREMHNKSNSEVQDMLMTQQKINWNDIDTWMKRGCSVYRSSVDPETNRAAVLLDREIPIFTKDREFVGNHIYTRTEQAEMAKN